MSSFACSTAVLLTVITFSRVHLIISCTCILLFNIMQYYEALAELGTGISIPLLLQTDKDPSQLKTQLPKAGEEVDTDVLTGSDSSRKRLVNNYYYHFHWAVRKTATIWAHAACNSPRYLVFNSKSCFIRKNTSLYSYTEDSIV